jgi:DNA polymerase-3 subunit delta'
MTLPWHTSALQEVDKMMAENRLPHALLITGIEGIGKFEFMQTVVGKLINNDEKIRKDTVREELDYPVLTRKSNYINLTYCRAGEMVEKSSVRSKHIRINQIRAFCDTLHKTADALQIGVVFYGDQMNLSAANGLLKTLEEPRENTLIIILAHHSAKLPITIVSRCQRIHINPAKNQASIDWLAEKIGVKMNAKEWLENAYGAPFEALKNQEQYELQQQYQQQLITLSTTPNSNKMDVEFDNETLVFSCLQTILIAVIRAKNTQDFTHVAGLEAVTEQADTEHLLDLLKDVQYALQLESNRVNIKLLLENVLIVWSHITHLKQYPKITGATL